MHRAGPRAKVIAVLLLLPRLLGYLSMAGPPETANIEERMREVEATIARLEREEQALTEEAQAATGDTEVLLLRQAFEVQQQITCLRREATLLLEETLELVRQAGAAKAWLLVAYVACGCVVVCATAGALHQSSAVGSTAAT